MRFILLLLVTITFSQCKSDQVDAPKVITEAGEVIEIKHVDIKGAKRMIAENADLIVIDARTAEEYAEGTLPKAINIDVKADDFAVRLDSLDKSAVYLMHCRSGARSMKASKIMLDKGFTNITNMDGGYLAWIEDVE